MRESLKMTNDKGIAQAINDFGYPSGQLGRLMLYTTELRVHI